MEQTTRTEAELVADLNDLLKLDHDAVQAYALAIGGVESDAIRSTLETFRGDHERHITDLTRLIDARGATPIQLPHLPTGAFKLAVQAAGVGAGRLGGGDGAILLAFKANERQVRDKYRRVARDPHPADVSAVLARGADDEARHYAWVLETLDELGMGAGSTAGRVERVVEVAHSHMADVVESAERETMVAAQRLGHTMTDQIRRNPIGSAIAAVGAGIVLAGLFRQGRK